MKQRVNSITIRPLLYYLLLFLSLETASGNNNEPVIHWGNPIPKSGKEDFVKVLGTWQENVLLLKKEKRNLFESEKLTIEFFPEGKISNKESARIPLTIGDSDELTLNDILILEGKIISIASINHKRQKKTDIYFSILERGQKNFSTNIFLKSIATGDEDEKPEDVIKAVSSGNGFFILYPIPNNGIGKQIEIIQVDSNGKIINTRLVPLPDNHRNIEIGESYFTADSTLFFSIKNIKDNLTYTIVSINFKNSKTNIAELELPKMNISAIRLLVEDNLLYVGGFLKEKKKNASPSAFFTAGFDAELNMIHQLSFTDFNKTKDKSNNPENGKNKEWIDLKALGILKVKNGLFLIGEQQRTDNICISDFRTGFIRCNNYYYFVDLLCIYAGFDQKSWKTTIHKYQSSIDDFGIYGSVVLTSDRDSTCIMVFNDHKKNIFQNSTEVKTMNNPSKSHCVAVSIDINGKLKKFNLYSSREQNIILIPSMHAPKRNKELYVYGERSGISRIGLLSLP